MNRLVIQQQTLISPRSAASPLADRGAAKKIELPADSARDRAVSAERPATFARALQKKRKQSDAPANPDRERVAPEKRAEPRRPEESRVTDDVFKNETSDEASESEVSTDSRDSAPDIDSFAHPLPTDERPNPTNDPDPLKVATFNNPEIVAQADAQAIQSDRASVINNSIAVTPTVGSQSGLEADTNVSQVSDAQIEANPERASATRTPTSVVAQFTTPTTSRQTRVATASTSTKQFSASDAEQPSATQAGESESTNHVAQSAADRSIVSLGAANSREENSSPKTTDSPSLNTLQPAGAPVKPLAPTASPRPSKGSQSSDNNEKTTAATDSTEEESAGSTLAEAWSQQPVTKQAVPSRPLSVDHAAGAPPTSEQPFAPAPAAPAVERAPQEAINSSLTESAARNSFPQLADEKQSPSTPTKSLPGAVDLLGRLAAEPLQTIGRANAQTQASTPEFQRALNAQVQRGVEQAAAQAAASGAWAGASAAGSGSVMLRLHPANLGMLRVYLRMDGAAAGGSGSGGVKARFEVSSARAKGILGSSIESLRTALQERGLTMDEVTITDMPQMPERGFGLPPVAETARDAGTAFADHDNRGASDHDAQDGAESTSGARMRSSAESGGVQASESVWESGEQPSVLAALSPSDSALMIGADGRVFLNALV